MRLIDADKAKEKAECYNWDTVAIDNAPTVEAIPVEWLKEHYPTTQVYGTEQYFRTAYAVQDILAEWKREKE